MVGLSVMSYDAWSSVIKEAGEEDDCEAYGQSVAG